ncbi:electron transfer flavoprotein subunit alpha/FixB family protein [Psychroflexus maritimus]|uniref:Electron transfer flavoprotein subunit alpha/FixB family protein n=1 Tax=Psychroflexus maritimus TaxID=2714865 RepID=A0A967ADC5_9FLAO|nr:electron transfer flavoprotein subunit alpha/FixB family protein [Psychroflexus maritimus]NGZ90162.1 electron transfer flavoprotein subunit alpha/FixB family protein [Psychroflexus maritimus]
MSILVYTETENGKFKKASFEVASYAKAIADQTGGSVTAVAFNAANPQELEKYGVNKVLHVENEKLQKFNADAYAQVITEATKQETASIIVVSQSANAKYLAPLLAVNLEAGYASNVVEVPNTEDAFTVKRTAFTNKAFNETAINTSTKIIGLSTNSFGVHESETSAEIISFEGAVTDENFKINVESVDKNTDKVSIADAEVVISGGRGLKGPENWHLIEDLAETLNAATACSKPVSDMGWRPHGEHVGQTGKPVATNLYIAIGISGAIQHLAGISASKTKVVINNDPEAPFFKAADYGIVGDAFEVIPKLTEKLKEFKANNA